MKKILLLIILSFTFVINSEATHLMGGEITWKCIKSGPNMGKYIFQVKVYRDCQGIPIDTTINLDVHNIPGLLNLPLTWFAANDLSPSCDTLDGPNSPFSCNGTNNGLAGNGVGAVEEHIYISDTVRIIGAPDADGWHFTWSSCCRNNAITNGLAGEGFTLRAVMYSYTDSLGTVHPSNNNCYDSSPKFYESPRTILEANNGYDPLAFSNGFIYSHNAFDDERDSLRYDFAQPLDDGFYDYTNPSASGLQISGSIPGYAPLSNLLPIPGVAINHYTGRTYYPADYIGNFVTCTKVEAWKCGQLVSEVYREIQVVLSTPICNLGDTTGGNVGADTLCNVRPLVQPPFFFPLGNPQYQWDTIVHCGDTVSFDFIANDYDVYPNGSLQDLQFSVSGGQFLNYNVSPPALCDNPPCATFQEISSGATPPFTTSGGTGSGYFEWITSCNHTISTCGNDLLPSLYTFIVKVQDDFCPAPAIENTAQVISIMVCPPCNVMKANATSTPATCAANNGTISVSPSNGLPPYQAFYFDMNGIPVNPNSLIAGDYEVRVRDSSLCETIDTITVTQFNYTLDIDTSATIMTDTICFNSLNGSIDITPIGGVLPYTFLWSNGALTEDINGLDSGLYTVVISDSLLCNSSPFSFYISSYLASSSTTNFTACDSYSWNGQILTVSGIYDSTFSNLVGCDSTANLNLIINYSSSSTDSQVHCDTYIWVDGVTYTSSNNTATYMFQTLDGCDSLSTLDLTINYSTSSTDSQLHCDTYTWIDGVTYTSSNNTANMVYNNVVGCDSIVTLDLTINDSTSSTDTQVHCNTYTWVDGVTYLVSNNIATWMFQTVAGCDSIVTLDLTINYSTTSSTTITACDSYTWNGITYTTPGFGVYIFTTSNSVGCDSTATLVLTIFGGNNFSSNISSVSNSCYGDSDGSIDLTPLGVPPYAFLWSNGSITEDISGLTAGIYSVIITDSTTCTIFDTVNVLEPSQINSSLTPGVGTLTGIASGGLVPYSYTIYDPTNTFFASSVANFGTSFTVTPLVSGQYCMVTMDANGCADTACALFVTDFSPIVTVSISNNWCDSLTDLSITVTQDSGEVDMSTALFQSNAGSFDIASMSVGDTIGTSMMMAGGGLINLNSYLRVQSIISLNTAVIESIDTIIGNLGSFTISNQLGGGINIISNTIPDGNNYTSGNMSSVFFDNVFINPCIPLVFTATINSELGDVQITTFNFAITALYNIISDDIRIYPNPTQDRVTVDFNRNISDLSISLYDMLGKSIYYQDQFYNLNSKEIILDNLKGGSYLIIMNVDGVIYHHQIIIQD
jgi:hypothetical protein